MVNERVAKLTEQLKIAKEALEFYADPESYLAIGFFPDPPCGEFINDGSETEYGMKPGRRARDTLIAIEEKG